MKQTKCKHKWVFVEKFNVWGFRRKEIRYYVFHCEHCCKLKHIESEITD